jgi:hypothetical protein
MPDFNMPNMGAIHAVGSQFNGNAFKEIQEHVVKRDKHNQIVKAKAASTTAANRNAYAQSAESAIKAGRAAYVKSQMQQQKQAQQAAKAHSAGVKSGKVAPAPGAPPRTFAMAPSAQQKAQSKTMQQQRNFAHGEALKFQSAQFKIQQQQRNFAHGEALKEAARRERPTTTQNTGVAKPNNLSSTFSSAPVAHKPIKAQAIPSTTFSHQLAPQKASTGPRGSTTATFSSAEGRTTPVAKPISTSVTSPQFSHAEPVKPKSVTPTFSHKEETPKNLTPSFSDNGVTPRKPEGSTSIKFSG